MNLKKLFKFRISQRTDKDFVKFVRESVSQNYEIHHLLESFIGGKKHNDYLLYPVDKQRHSDIHYKNEITEEEFIEGLLFSLEKLFDYIKKIRKEK